MAAARNLHISGIVQGVGFRPFVYRQALRWGLTGWVLNASDGVHIHVEGDTASLDGFIAELVPRAPTSARVTSVEVCDGLAEGLSAFSIRESDENTRTSALVSPDIATCPDCLRELFDARDRRFHYPFINCTNCGPRFTIIRALPYDRPNTSMAPFGMCESCDAEYHDPLNRRFHAQPDACFDCGPSLRLWQSGTAGAEGVRGDGVQEGTRARGREDSDACIEQVVEMLTRGRIVAIKGIGGYHLACDATNEEAVAELRRRKRRVAKPFALMVRDLADARALCEVDALEAALLSGTVRPIVLLRRGTRAALSGEPTGGQTGGRTGGEVGGGPPGSVAERAPLSQPTTATSIAPSVAGPLNELGIMLPSTPLQHLLMAAVGRPLVMTSGNISEEPIIAREAEAHELLAGVADAFLDNDREILSRYDDSVVRVIDGRAYLIRRARGYAPRPLRFTWPPVDAPGSVPHRPDILAVGPEQKSTFCLVRGEDAFCSQHLGDLESASSFKAWLTSLTLYRRLFGLDYQVLACDTHPEYLSTKWARAQGEARLEVQHHHAHIASVLAEHRAKDDADPARDGSGATAHRAQGDRATAEAMATTGDIRLINRVIGIAFDGSGFGNDGAIWGGEALVASLTDFERFAHLRYIPLPGGRAAIDHPDRMAWSCLRACDLTRHRGAAALAERIGADRILLLDQMIAGHINTPLTSSMGRLFDAASALVGVCSKNSYEGQAAIEFEAALYDPATGDPVTDPDADDAAERYRFALVDAAAQAAQVARAENGADGESAADEDASGTMAGEPTVTVGEPAPTPEPDLIDPAPVLAALLDDCAHFVPAPLIALRFHEAVVRLIINLCEHARARFGLSTVALSGGVFMNRYLIAQSVPLLESEGFTVLLNRNLPANDGCISYGQAAVVAARLSNMATEGILLGT
jgi:hydrogenase maturation protein HypF